MHNDTTCPKKQYGSCSHAQIQDGVRDLELDTKSNKSPEPLFNGPATLEHMPALLPFKFPASGKYNPILDSFVTTTPTMHVRAAKALFDVIMHKVYSGIILTFFPAHSIIKESYLLLTLGQLTNLSVRTFKLSRK